MNKQIQVLGNQETENLRDRLLKQAGEDKLIKRVLRGVEGPERYVAPDDIDGLRLVYTIDESENPRAIDFSPDGKDMAIGFDEDIVRLYSITESAEGEAFGAENLETLAYDIHTSQDIHSISVSTARQVLAGLSDPGSIMLWQYDGTSDLKHINTINCPGMVTGVAFSPDGRYAIAGGFDQRLHVYAADEEEIYEIAMQIHGRGVIYDIAFSPDGKHIATACSDSFVRIFEFNSHSRGLCKIIEEPYPCYQISSLAFSHDGKYLAVADSKEPSHMDETGPRKPGITFYRFDGDGLDLHGKTDLDKLGLMFTIDDISFHPNGRWLAAVYGNYAGIFEIDRGVHYQAIKEIEMENK